jgi:glycosyltransferase involved in cell wall biosynthesis
LLVVTTVHHPDDTRIREKTIRSLHADFEVEYAARPPGPSDSSGLRWIPLPGSRPRRNLTAWWMILTGGHDLVAIHDPELIPPALLRRVLRRRPVVLDIHEDIPAQIRTKPWVPGLLRSPLALVLEWLLRVSERLLVITLAEEGYLARFSRPHPVIGNYPVVEHLPAPRPERTEGAVYVGDVTRERGLVEAAEATGRIGIPFTVIGPVPDELAAELHLRGGPGLELTGRLPHAEAMRRVASATVALSPLHDLPNYRHSIPTKLVEYLALGVPVVASDLPATRALAGGLDAVELVPPADTGALAEGIRRATRPGTIERAMDQVEEVRRRFTWPEERLRQVYRSAVVRAENPTPMPGA